MMRSRSSSLKSVDLGNESKDESIDVIMQINRELGELNDKLNVKRSGKSNSTLVSLNSELDSLNSNLKSWLQESTSRADDDMLDSYSRPIESLFKNCSNYAGRWSSVILSTATEAYSYIVNKSEDKSANKPLPPMNLNHQDTTPKIVKLLQMVGTGLEAVSMSDISFNPRNIPDAIQKMTQKTSEYVSSSRSCKTAVALENIKQINTDTEGYFTGQEEAKRSPSSSSSSSSSSSKKSSRRTVKSSSKVSAQRVTSKLKSSKKTTTVDSMYDADGSQAMDEDDDYRFGKGIKKSNKQKIAKKGRKTKKQLRRK